MAVADEIIAVEKQFWEAMKSKDADAAAGLTADQSVIAGASGVAVIDPAMMKQMLAGGTWTLESYAFEDVVVQELDADTAVIGYKVTERVTVDGAPVSLTAFDTSLWRRRGDQWTCALHTESLQGDSFGRDRK